MSPLYFETYQTYYTMNETVLTKIIDFIFGHKYYANIIHTRGTDKIEMSSFIHRTKAAANKHRDQIEETRLYRYIETISFRSRKDYDQSPLPEDTAEAEEL